MNWEFVLQQQGHNTWIHIKESTIQLMEGRYRLVLNSTLPDTDIEISITHDDINEKPPKRRFQKRSRRTNHQGLMLVLPFSYFKNGMWEITCNIPSHNDESDLKKSLQLQILKQPLSIYSETEINNNILVTENDPETEINNNILVTENEKIKITELETELETETEIKETEKAAEITNKMPDYSQEIKERSLQEVDNLINSDLESLNQQFTETRYTNLSKPYQPRYYPSFFSANTFKKQETEDIQLLLSIDNDRLIGHQGESLVITGDVEIIDINNNNDTRANNRGNSLYKGYLSINLRDPQNAEEILVLRYSLPKHRPPFDFECVFDLPENCYISLILGNITLYDSKDKALASQSFSITADLETLLYNWQNPYSQTSEYDEELEDLDLEYGENYSLNDYDEEEIINYGEYPQKIEEYEEEYEEEIVNKTPQRIIELMPTPKTPGVLKLQTVSNPIPAPVLLDGLVRNITSPQLPNIPKKQPEFIPEIEENEAEIEENEPEIITTEIMTDSVTEHYSETSNINVFEFLRNNLVELFVQTPNEIQFYEDQVTPIIIPENMIIPELIYSEYELVAEEIESEQTNYTENELEEIESEQTNYTEVKSNKIADINQAFADLKIQDKFMLRLNSLATDTEFVEMLKQELYPEDVTTESDEEYDDHDEIEEKETEEVDDYEEFTEELGEYETVAFSADANNYEHESEEGNLNEEQNRSYTLNVSEFETSENQGKNETSEEQEILPRELNENEDDIYDFNFMNDDEEDLIENLINSQRKKEENKEISNTDEPEEILSPSEDIEDLPEENPTYLIEEIHDITPRIAGFLDIDNEREVEENNSNNEEQVNLNTEENIVEIEVEYEEIRSENMQIELVIETNPVIVSEEELEKEIEQEIEKKMEKQEEKPEEKEIKKEKISKEIVIDDDFTMPTLEEILASKRNQNSKVAQKVTPIPKNMLVPTPELIIPQGELIAGETITVYAKIPPYEGRIYIKLWIQDRQTRFVLEPPKTLTEFEMNMIGEWETITELIVPLGSLEARFEAIAIDLYTQQESGKVSIDRVIVPANLPEFTLYLDDNE